MNKEFHPTEYEKDMEHVVQKLHALSQRVRPEARDLHTILSKIPERKKNTNPFSFFVWKLTPAFAILLIAVGVVGYSGYQTLAPVVTPSIENTTAVVPTTASEQFAQELAVLFEEEIKEEQKIAYTENAIDYSVGDSEDVALYGDAYESYDY